MLAQKNATQLLQALNPLMLEVPIYCVLMPTARPSLSAGLGECEGPLTLEMTWDMHRRERQQLERVFSTDHATTHECVASYRRQHPTRGRMRCQVGKKPSACISHLQTRLTHFYRSELAYKMARLRQLRTFSCMIEWFRSRDPNYDCRALEHRLRRMVNNKWPGLDHSLQTDLRLFEAAL